MQKYALVLLEKNIFISINDVSQQNIYIYIIQLVIYLESLVILVWICFLFFLVMILLEITYILLLITKNLRLKYLKIFTKFRVNKYKERKNGQRQLLRCLRRILFFQ